MVDPQSARTRSSGDSHGSSAATEPRGRRSVFVARVAGWMIVPLYVAGVCTSYVLQRRAGLLHDNSMETTALFVGFGAFAVVGAMLVAKRPTNAIGWIMAAVALMLSTFLAGDSDTAYVVVTRGQPDALAVVGAWTGSWYWYALLALALVYLPLLFPDGRLPSHRWLPVAVLAGVGTLGVVVLAALADTPPVNEAPGYEIDNPVGIEGLGYVEDIPVFGVLGVILGVAVIGAVASVVVRFRRSRGIERQQMKWFVYAVAPVLVMPIEVNCRGSSAAWRSVRYSLGCPLPHRGRGAEVSPLRHRRPDKPHPRLRLSYRAAGDGVRGEHRGAPGGIPLAYGAGLAAHPRRLDAGDSGPFKAPCTAASRRSWIGASTAASTTQPRPSPPSALGCATKPTSQS